MTWLATYRWSQIISVSATLTHPLTHPQTHKPLEVVSRSFVRGKSVLQSLFFARTRLPHPKSQRTLRTRVNADATCEAIGSQLTVHDRFDRRAWRNPDAFLAVIAFFPVNAYTKDAYMLKQPCQKTNRAHKMAERAIHKY